MKWQTVYVFISSTFNDMHAERDLLVKSVFPELRMWCAKRKLKLVDIDLRWGISAADAQENKRVVEVCMKNIDKCRPFFLCFLGQRRGWVPDKNDINSETLELFPQISEYIGHTSVTELEIIHALMHPFSDGTLPVEHARFYFRNKSYLKQLKTPEHKALFCPKAGVFSQGDFAFEHFKKKIQKKYTITEYTADWNDQKRSYEFSGVLSNGRLDNFCVADDTLANDVLFWLQEEITKAFPEHYETKAMTSSLDRELENQDIIFFQASDGYIARPVEEKALLDIIDNNRNHPILLLADAGCGKTSLLARMIHTLLNRQRVYYRFVGTTPQSFKKKDLASSLIQQWIRDGLLTEDDGKYSAEELVLMFSRLLKKAWKSQPFTLILDGIDQLTDEMDDRFLPHEVPNGCSLIFSLRSDAKWMPEEYVLVHRLSLMENREDKIQMVKEYLGTFLKDIDEKQQEQLLSMKGSGNPLYMKIVLNELRQHGSFDTLFEIFEKNYGSTPIEAFEQVILRIRQQLINQGYSEFITQLFFGCLACTQEGLDSNLFFEAFHTVSDTEINHFTKPEVHDIIYGLARELEAFLVLDGDKVLLRYDSLRRAFFKMYPSFDQLIHSILAIAFAKRAIQDEIPHYMECAMYHIGHAHEKDTYSFFIETRFVLWSIEHNGSKLLVDTLQKLAYDRGFAQYELLAQIVRQASARLDTNPQTFFMELRRYSNLDHLFIQKMLAQEEKYVTQNYLVPVTPPTSYSSVIQNEYVLPEISNLRYSEPHYVMVTRFGDYYAPGSIVVVDRRTTKMMNLLQLEDRERDDYTLLTINNHLAYECRYNRNIVKYVKAYSLPDLELVSENRIPYVLPSIPEEFYIEDKQIYFVCKEQLPEKIEKISIICGNTGENMYSASAIDECCYRFLGKYFVYLDRESGEWFIIRTKDGKVLVKDHFTGIKRTPSQATHYKANMYAAWGRTLVVWLTGINIIDKKPVFEVDVRNYKILENGELELLAHFNKPEDIFINGMNVLSGATMNVLSSGHIVVQCQGVLCVLDEFLNIMGYMGEKELVSNIVNYWEGKIQLVDRDSLLFFHSKKIQTLSFQTLLNTLTPEPVKVRWRDCGVAVKNGWIYLFREKLTRINYITLQKETAPGKAGAIERICPWNIDNDFSCTSTDYEGVGYTQHFLNMRWEANHCRAVDPNIGRLLYAFQYNDEHDNIANGLVISEKKPYYHTYQGEEKKFLRCHLYTQDASFLAHVWGKKNTWSTKNLEIEVLDTTYLRVESINYGSDSYIVFPNVYKNEHEMEIRIYKASDGSLFFSHTIPSPVVPEFDILCYNKGFFLNYTAEEGQRVLYHLELEQKLFIRLADERKIIGCPSQDDYVYLYRDGGNIDVYSLSEREIVKSFTLTERNGLLLCQILRVKDYLIVRSFDSDILEIYNFEDGQKLFEQRMEQRMENLYLDPESQRFAMLDKNWQVHIWKIR